MTLRPWQGSGGWGEEDRRQASGVGISALHAWLGAPAPPPDPATILTTSYPIHRGGGGQRDGERGQRVRDHSVKGHSGGPGPQITPSIISCYGLSIFIFIFRFLGPHLRHMEVPRLGVRSELQLPAHTTAKATPDLSRICDLCHSLWQRRILNLLSKTRDQTASSWKLAGFLTHWATIGTPRFSF